MRRVVWLGLLVAVLWTAPAAAYEATIRRSAHGIPHIEAKDYGSLAYGYGYAFAEDNLCVMADQYVTVRAERSRYFGPEATWQMRGNGTTNKNRESDFFFQRIINDRTVEQLLDRPPPHGPREEIRDGVRGYVAGYNRYLRDVGVANLPDPACRGKEWVKPIEEMDAYRRFYQLALLASGGVAINGIGGAQPPPPGAATQQAGSMRDFAELGERLPLGGIGSNAYGIGRDQTDNGKGMLLGNPHFPWDGTERFYQAHLTIPGKVDVSGGSLFGVPIVLIGHTNGMAWSHTVSTAFRFTPFEEKLVPGSPTTYLVDGQPREMERDQVTIQVKGADGQLKPESRTLYSTVHGPVFTELLGQPLFPWTPAAAFAMGDANASNFRYLNHFFETNLAQTVDEYDQVLRRNQGIPWVNSIAADSKGDAYYADISVVPHVTDDHAERCNTVLGRGTFELLGLPVLDGTRSSCDWGRDPSAIQPGTLGPQEHLPSLKRSDYVMNANDSYWLSNLKARLEGFPRIVGPERTARSLRTRIGLLMVDGQRYTLQKLMDTVFNNRQYAGELWLQELLAVCDSTPGLADTCAALRAWNVRDDLDSKAALLFRRIAQRLLGSGPTSAPPPWEVPFDPNDPANTPRGLREDDPRVRQALQEATNEVRGLGLALDAPLGDVQAELRGTERFPIHGGPGTAGVFNAINVTTASLEDGKGYTSIPHGSSFVQAVQFRDGGCAVDPRTILTYSQSTNRESPWHSDQTRMYGRKEWNNPPFCADDVRRRAISEMRLRSDSPGSAACQRRTALTGAGVRPRGRGARVTLPRASGGEVVVDVFRSTSGRRVLAGRRVARVRGRGRAVTWSGRGARRDGTYVIRVRAGGARRHYAVARRRGRIRMLPAIERGPSCGALRGAGLGRPVFGGRNRRPLSISFVLGNRADVTVRIRRAGRTVRTIRARGRRAGRLHRLTISPRRFKRGRYTVVVSVRGARATFTASRL